MITDEMIFTIIVISFSATFGIFAAMTALIVVYAAVKRLLNAAQGIIYFLLKGK